MNDKYWMLVVNHLEKGIPWWLGLLLCAGLFVLPNFFAAKLGVMWLQFPGLDKDGNKKQQVCNGVNAPKICIWLGNPYKVDMLDCLENGRRFLKEKLPSLVDETDEEWAAQMSTSAARV